MGQVGTVTPDDPRHGTSNGYSNLKCRCARCKRANADAHTAWRRRNGIGRPYEQYLADVMQHGAACYRRRGCRCEVCRAAMAAQKRRQRARNANGYNDRQNAARRERHKRTGK